MVELLAPGGNLEKLKMAVLYGADAVYIGGSEFGLRAKADNFSPEEMKEGIKFAHSKGKKVYVTMNIIPRNSDFENMEQYIREIEEMGADAVLVSDPGIFSLVKRVAPNMQIHISTQANNTNYMSAAFWKEQGASRVVLARELSLEEIKYIHEKNSDIELEAFVHGAMCISYSGRCLLSGYMTGRDSNRGDCAQACRWSYRLVEEKRPGEYMPVYENERGTFIFNSKDLCLLEHIPELIKAGVYSLKIEGRMKSSFYVASVVRAYRMAIDKYYRDPDNWSYDPKWLEEASKASHREYTKAFFLGKTQPDSTQNYGTNSYIRGYDFIGLCREYDKNRKIVLVEQRNKVSVGDEVEVVMPSGEEFSLMIKRMTNEKGEDIENAPHAQMIFGIECEREILPFSMIRKKSDQKI